MKGNIRVILDGRGPLTLRDSDYVATGGEGSVYRANDTIVKLYTDKAKMVRDGMDEKIRVLASKFNRDGIVAPQGVVLNESSAPIGYYMPFADGEPMARAFVSDFRSRTGFSDGDAIKAVERMRDIVAFAHSQKALMVDANELNWLINLTKSGPFPRVIDVDSWAIARWPATVIMPSIRDWNASTFSESTDWFAWGIVTFQLFTGIHPYKGKIDGYKPGELVRRMKERASVFDWRIKLPHSVRDFSCIPGPLLDWFQATFQDGARSLPPASFGASKPPAAAVVMHTAVSSGGAVTLEKLIAYPGNHVVKVWPSGAALMALGEVIDISTRRVIGPLPPSGEVVRAATGWLLAGWKHHIDYYDGSKIENLPIALAVKRYFRSGNRIFAVTDQELVELQLRILGKPVISTGMRVSIRPNSTNWFDGVAVQDVFGNAFLLFPTETGIVQPRVKEIDGANIVSAKAAGRFAAFVVLDKSGDYRKIELSFDKSFSTYSAWSGGTDSPDLNLAIMPTGVVATIVNDGELTLFVPSNGNVNKIADRSIQTDMMLSAWGSKLLYLKDGDIWQLSMSSPT